MYLDLTTRGMRKKFKIASLNFRATGGRKKKNRKCDKTKWTPPPHKKDGQESFFKVALLFTLSSVKSEQMVLRIMSWPCSF